MSENVIVLSCYFCSFLLSPFVSPSFSFPLPPPFLSIPVGLYYQVVKSHHFIMGRYSSLVIAKEHLITFNCVCHLKILSSSIILDSFYFSCFWVFLLSFCVLSYLYSSQWEFTSKNNIKYISPAHHLAPHFFIIMLIFFISLTVLFLLVAIEGLSLCLSFRFLSSLFLATQRTHSRSTRNQDQTFKSPRPYSYQPHLL